MTPATNSGSAPVLVVDDDRKILSLVRTYLEREGYVVLTASDGMAALRAFRQANPRLMVLDVMLPEVDGLAVLRTVREDSDIPVLLLSAEGADDYLPKPFSPAELVARVNAILRRTGTAGQGRPAPQAVIHWSDLAIDRDRHEVRQAGRPLGLTAAEFRLLAAIVQADGRVLSRELLLDVLYGVTQADALDRTIDVHIGRLRDKLGDDADRPRYIATVRGVGYRAVGLAHGAS